MSSAEKGCEATTRASVQPGPATTPGEGLGERPGVPSESDEDHFSNFEEDFRDESSDDRVKQIAKPPALAAGVAKSNLGDSPCREMAKIESERVALECAVPRLCAGSLFDGCVLCGGSVPIPA